MQFDPLDPVSPTNPISPTNPLSPNNPINWNSEDRSETRTSQSQPYGSHRPPYDNSLAIAGAIGLLVIVAFFVSCGIYDWININRRRSRRRRKREL